MVETLLIAILIAAVVVVFVFWLADYAGIPEPANKIIKIVVAILALLFVLNRSGLEGI